MRALNIAATGMAAQNMRSRSFSHNLEHVDHGLQRAAAAALGPAYQQIQRPGTVKSADGRSCPRACSSASASGPPPSRCRSHRAPRWRPAGRSTSPSRARAIWRSRCRAASRPLPATGAQAGRRRADRDLRRLHRGSRHHHSRGRAPDHHQRRRRGLRLFRRAGGRAAARPVQPRLLQQREGARGGGSNLYRETEASGQPNVGAAGEDGRGTFRQGYLESSSVDAVHEITGLIEAQRGYELNAKVITAADQMLAAMTQIR